MRRRDFMMVMGGAAAAWPHAMHAQDVCRIYRLGLMTSSLKIAASPITAFFDELGVLGFVEGQNLKVDGGYGLRDEQLPEIAAAMAKSPPDVIYCAGVPQMRAKQQAMSAVPIVGLNTDMIATGLVKSLADPGGNITGISLLSPELEGKRQDILIEAVPGARRMAMLADANATGSQQLKAIQDAARAHGVEFAVVTIRTHDDIVPAMNDIKTSGVSLFIPLPEYLEDRFVVLLIASSTYGMHRFSSLFRFFYNIGELAAAGYVLKSISLFLSVPTFKWSLPRLLPSVPQRIRLHFSSQPPPPSSFVFPSPY